MTKMVVDPDTIRDIIVAIVQQAVTDWEALERGRYANKRYRDGFVRRKELIRFFNSQAFDGMSEFAFSVPGEAIRDALGVPREINRND